MLRMFANWCTENANDIGLAPWECLSDDMTLFDVVYLDIVHGFDVPFNVLLEYVDRGWSAELVSKLGVCYCFNRLDQLMQRNESKYSIHFKTFLMMQRAIEHEYISIETISTCVSLLIKHEEYAIVARVLESGAAELWESNVSVLLDNVFFSIMSSKTTKDLRELSIIAGREFVNNLFRISVRIFFCYASYVCYKNLENGESLRGVRIRMHSCFVDLMDNGNAFSDYVTFLLLLEVFEDVSEMRSMHHNLFMVMKSKIIKRLDQNADHKEMRGKEQNNHDFIDPRFRLFCSCNRRISDELQLIFFGRSYDHKDINYDLMEIQIARATKSTADRMYHVLLLIFVNKYEQAAALLNAVIDEEGEYSLSVVICPYAFWESNFLDDSLCRELKKLSADLVVFPTELFARYLLVNVSISLGRMEQWRRNMTEFNILRQRYYSSVSDYFAPILNALSKSLEQY